MWECVDKRQEGININNSKLLHRYKIILCSFLTVLPEEVFHTTVILDPGAGPCVDNHGDNVLISSTRSKRQDVLACSPNVHFEKQHLICVILH